MAKYRPVDQRVWSDRRFLACGDDARLLWLFLLTCPSLPIPGVIIGGDASLAEQLGWTVERFQERFRELCQTGLGVAREGRIVWLKNALKYQPPANPNMLKGWAKTWDDVPEGQLKHELWQALKIACKSWSSLFSKLFAEPFQDGSANRSPNGLANRFTHEHEHEHEHQHQHDQEEALSRAHAIPPSAELAPAPVATPPQPISTWHQRKAAWDAMLQADERIRDAGIEPNAPKLPTAPAGENEKLLAACARDLAASYGEGEVAAKLQHVVLVAEAEAKREGHRRWFKPAVIWEPKRAARAAATSLEEASTPLQPPPRAGPRGSAARAPNVGRIEPAKPEEYQSGDVAL